jgi:hypothetical protein
MTRTRIQLPRRHRPQQGQAGREGDGANDPDLDGRDRRPVELLIVTLKDVAVGARRKAALEVAYQPDHIAETIGGGVVPAEPDLLEHPE